MKFKTVMILLSVSCSLGAVLFVRSTLQKHQSVKAAQDNFRATQDYLAARDANLPRFPEGQDQKQMKAKFENYFTKVRRELGQDDIGNAAMVIFLRQISPKVVESNPKLKFFCKTQKTCPINLMNVYKESLNRLDLAFDGPAKEVLQEQLVQSDLPRETKILFLTQNMTATHIQNIGARSILINGSKIQFGPSAQYMVLTGRQLLQLKTEAPQYLQTMMTALSHSNDPVAKAVVMNGLAKSYPKYGRYISTQAKTMGVKMASLN